MALPVTGCDPATVAQVAEKSPKEALLAAVPQDSAGPLRFSGKDDTNDISGSIDPQAKALQLATSMKQDGIAVHMSFLIVAEQAWVKMRFTGDRRKVALLPKYPDRWMHLNRAKLTGDGAVPTYDGADQGNTGVLIENATSVEDKGDGRYAGTVDLTSGEAAKVLDAAEMTALGAAAKQVPFTGKVIGHNLAEFTMDVPAAGKHQAFRYVVNYTDYGTAPKLTAPSGPAAQEAPASLYQLMNG
ncbi:hypothetical protein ACFFWC_17125 [Plantactinospora siamensis]|uniref:Lipoprotein n=2 Tax=Plantactinospora siamensis TaxID=555372 RepID=A0ABV6NXU2_9ACTN